MRLAGGEFELQPFSEPPMRTIESQWEFLLMEAARKRDEDSGPSRANSAPPPLAPPVELSNIPDLFAPPSRTLSPPGVATAPEPVTAANFQFPAAPAPGDSARREGQRSAERVRPTIEEVLFCSLQGEVLQEWQCANPSGRISFLEFLSQKARQLGQGLTLGEFDRLEVNGESERIVARIQPEWALFARIRKGGENQTTP
jgi:hypothetical protein